MKIPTKQNRLRRPFFDRDAALVARELLGKALVRRIDDRSPSGSGATALVGGVIVETEAYLHDGDLASHSARGRTAGNASMFGPAGRFYVYPIHAKHCCNAVTGPAGQGSAVLIRAIEPIWGVEVMRRLRGQSDPRRLTRGPGMICQALAIDRTDDGLDLVTDPAVYIAPMGETTDAEIVSRPRIGISKAKDLPLRFFFRGNRFVSGRVADHD